MMIDFKLGMLGTTTLFLAKDVSLLMATKLEQVSSTSATSLDDAVALETTYKVSS